MKMKNIYDHIKCGDFGSWILIYINGNYQSIDKFIKEYPFSVVVKSALKPEQTVEQYLLSKNLGITGDASKQTYYLPLFDSYFHCYYLDDKICISSKSTDLLMFARLSFND